MSLFTRLPLAFSICATPVANGARPDPRCGVPKNATAMVQRSSCFSWGSNTCSDKQRAFFITKPPEAVHYEDNLSVILESLVRHLSHQCDELLTELSSARRAASSPSKFEA